MNRLKNEIVYLGRDNHIDLVLLADGAAPDLSAVTRMQLLVGDTILDSSDLDGVFDWSTETVSSIEAAQHPGAPAGANKLILALGGQDIAPGYYTARLIVYDVSNPDGLVWGDLSLQVTEG